MKKIISVLVLVLAISLAASAGKPVKTAPPPPSIIVSPPDYNPGDPISFIGSGFAAKDDVYIDVLGPYYMGMSVSADHKGNFSVDYPGGLAIPGGYYTVVAGGSKSGDTAPTGLVVE